MTPLALQNEPPHGPTPETRALLEAAIRRRYALLIELHALSLKGSNPSARLDALVEELSVACRHEVALLRALVHWWRWSAAVHYYHTNGKHVEDATPPRSRGSVIELAELLRR